LIPVEETVARTVEEADEESNTSPEQEATEEEKKKKKIREKNQSAGIYRSSILQT
jgi:hypothetical protein